MKILIVGSGAREHALAWKAAQSPVASEIIITPGNVGCESVAETINIASDDIQNLVRLAKERNIDLTIVGPEIPLSLGIVEEFERKGLRIFGPSSHASRIESSKSWAKHLMDNLGIPTAHAHFFETAKNAWAYVQTLYQGAYVIKADGLLAGKGVVVPKSHEAAKKTLHVMEQTGILDEGKPVLIEDKLEGKEISVFAFIDGPKVSHPVSACDYKRAFDGDTGGNTGGMGSYSPFEGWNRTLENDIRANFIKPVAEALVERGTPYKGMLYLGMMLTPHGSKVIEFNCRFGDPECQALMPLMESDLVAICNDVASPESTTPDVKWSEKTSVAVVAASEGYPGEIKRGEIIYGMGEAEKKALMFYSGLSHNASGQIVNSGGRVATAVGVKEKYVDAKIQAYSAFSKFNFKGMHYRSDISEHLTLFTLGKLGK